MVTHEAALPERAAEAVNLTVKLVAELAPTDAGETVTEPTDPEGEPIV
jgi:hypothetical protein